MYLSRLWPNLRHYYTRRQMGLPYELHRTLARAFPEKEHGGMGRVLFRVEQMKDRAQTVLVLSELQPDWRPERFVHQGVVIWEAETKSGQYDPTFSKGDICAFRLLANPTVKREGKRLAWLREGSALMVAAQRRTAWFHLVGRCASADADGLHAWHEGGQSSEACNGALRVTV